MGTLYEPKYTPAKIFERWNRNRWEHNNLVALVRGCQIRDEYRHILSTEGVFEQLYEVTKRQEPALKD